MKKILKWTGLVIGIIAIGVFVWQKNRAEPFVPVDDETFFKTNPSEKELTRYLKNMEEAYAADAYGGSTPEETLNLFIAALKAGDTDLAAKYFLVEEQERMKEELKHGIKSGGITTFLKSVVEEKQGFFTGESIYTFEIPAPESSKFILELVRNPYTQKWKIENL